MFPVHKKVEQLKMNHMFNIVHGISPAYLKEDISLQDNASHQTRSVTSLSYHYRVPTLFRFLN